MLARELLLLLPGNFCLILSTLRLKKAIFSSYILLQHRGKAQWIFVCIFVFEAKHFTTKLLVAKVIFRRSRLRIVLQKWAFNEILRKNWSLFDEQIPISPFKISSLQLIIWSWNVLSRQQKSKKKSIVLRVNTRISWCLDNSILACCLQETHHEMSWEEEKKIWRICSIIRYRTSSIFQVLPGTHFEATWKLLPLSKSYDDVASLNLSSRFFFSSLLFFLVGNGAVLEKNFPSLNISKSEIRIGCFNQEDH